MKADIGGNLLVESVFEIAFKKIEKSAAEKPIFQGGGKNATPVGTQRVKDLLTKNEQYF